MIFQELNLIPHLTVAENIFLGREPLNRFGLIDYAAMNRDTAAHCSGNLILWCRRKPSLGLLPRGPASKWWRLPGRLPPLRGSSSWMSPPRPSPNTKSRCSSKTIADLKRKGVAIAYITHKLDELTRIHGDDAIIMRDE